MKKMLFVQLLTALFLSAVVVSAEVNPPYDEDQLNSRVSPAGVGSEVDVGELQAQIEKNLYLLDEAANQKNLNDVIKIGEEVLEQAKVFKDLVPPNGKIGLVNGVPTLGYTLARTGPVEEYVLLAKVMKHKMTLADLLETRTDLLKGRGPLAWVSENVKRMNVNYMPIAEVFREWNGCSDELQAAQQKGLHIRRIGEVCK